MRIVILGGSPKSNKNSITMQYVSYLETHFTSCEFVVFNISRNISVKTNDPSYFSKIKETISSCDGVLWAFPVYFYHVPSHYKKFIELVFENQIENVFRNKYAASFSSSIHMFDDIAHDYINGICTDLNMKFVDSLSLDVYDFLDPVKLKVLIMFFRNFINSIQDDSITFQKFPLQERKQFSFFPNDNNKKIDPSGKKILIIADKLTKNSNIQKMCGYFSNAFISSPETFVLDKLAISQGCTGCLSCGYDHSCPLPDSYIFNDIHSEISSADIIVFAGEIKDRFFSSLWKLFFDRLFCCGHPPNIFINKQIAFFVSGPLLTTPTFLRFLHAFTETEKINLAGIIHDDSIDSDTLSAFLSQFAQRIVSFSLINYIKPNSFIGVGGLKVVQGDVWKRHSYIFKSDIKNYKRQKTLSFSLKKWGLFLYTKSLGLLTRFPFFRKILNKHLLSLLCSLFRKIVK